ncbi:MAG: four helix bundle protein [Ignavibacteria bacterium]|nr:four helix bundle protein [Ignavibacteria bacterium]
MKDSNVIVEKSFKFAVRIVNLYKYLNEKKKEFVLSKQVLRSGTSVGANIEEAIGGRTRKDFISILSIAYKETRETKFWLKLLKECNYLDNKLFKSIYDDCEEISKILSSIIITSKARS